MTLDEVVERVKAISERADDAEVAHSMEDGLYRDVLAAISAFDCEDPVLCARAALRSTELNFPRWCA